MNTLNAWQTFPCFGTNMISDIIPEKKKKKKKKKKKNELQSYKENLKCIALPNHPVYETDFHGYWIFS